MKGPLDEVRRLAANPDSISFGGDFVFSAGGCSVSTDEVIYALQNATDCDDSATNWVVTGPTSDAPSTQRIRVVLRVANGRVLVRDVSNEEVAP